jgi:hypothetical protein
MANFFKQSDDKQGMPEHLKDSKLGEAWNQVVSLAKEQGVNPKTGAVKVEGDNLSADVLAALAAVGGASIVDNGDGVNVKLAFSEPEEQDDEPEPTSIKAAAKKHTFA